MLYNLLKRIYFFIPLKKYPFSLLKKIYTPSDKIAGYLKFNGLFDVNVGALNLRIYNNNSTLASLIFWKGMESYEQNSLKTWMMLSRDAMVIMDIGANFGLFGLLSKTVNPKSSVYFFEPLERNCNLIKKNVTSNNFDDTKIFELALSDSNGIIDFYDMDSIENTIGSLDPDFIKSHSHSKNLLKIKVESKTLDYFIEENKIQHVDLLKIDVEGAELKVLKGFEKYIQEYVPDIIIEIAHNDTANAIQVFFKQINMSYNYYEIDEHTGINKVASLLSGKGRNFLLSKKLL